jgi:hypothetical protein
MSHFEEEKENIQIEHLQVEDALRNFRASVHAWSERELRTQRQPVPRRHWIMAPAMAWGLASILAVTAVTVPVSVHHERQVAATRRAAELEREQKAAEAARQAASAIDDEALLTHVDSDIAQSTPDAMEPLASLMRDTSNQ